MTDEELARELVRRSYQQPGRTFTLSLREDNRAWTVEVEVTALQVYKVQSLPHP